MEIINGENFYSCTEIAKGINNELEEFKELASLFRTIYKKKDRFFFSDTYIQSKLYIASDKNRIRYISFKRNNQNIVYRSYAIKDVINFLNSPDAYHISKCEKLNDVKIIEVGTDGNKGS